MRRSNSGDSDTRPIRSTYRAEEQICSIAWDLDLMIPLFRKSRSNLKRYCPNKTTTLYGSRRLNLMRSVKTILQTKPRLKAKEKDQKWEFFYRIISLMVKSIFNRLQSVFSISKINMAHSKNLEVHSSIWEV